MTTANLRRLRSFISDLAILLQDTNDEAHILEAGGALLRSLLTHDDWLPEAYAQADPERYRQYLLHCDSLERFSVVSFVWGPGQATPVHDHTVWGVVGVLCGAELSQAYVRQAGGLAPSGALRRLEPGQVQAVSPRIGDIHKVANAFEDRTSISIHVYGGNIGALRRSTYDPEGAGRAIRLRLLEPDYAQPVGWRLTGEPATPPALLVVMIWADANAVFVPRFDG